MSAQQLQPSTPPLSHPWSGRRVPARGLWPWLTRCPGRYWPSGLPLPELRSKARLPRPRLPAAAVRPRLEVVVAVQEEEEEAVPMAVVVELGPVAVAVLAPETRGWPARAAPWRAAVGRHGPLLRPLPVVPREVLSRLPHPSHQHPLLHPPPSSANASPHAERVAAGTRGLPTMLRQRGLQPLPLPLLLWLQQGHVAAVAGRPWAPQ